MKEADLLYDDFTIRLAKSNAQSLIQTNQLVHSFQLNLDSEILVANYQNANQFFYLENQNVVILARGQLILKEDIARKILNAFHNNLIIQTLHEYNSFLLIIFFTNEKKFAIISDRLSTKKAFYYKDKNQLLISSRLGFYLANKFSINKKTLGWYLANGASLGSHTIFKEIYQSKAGECTELNYNIINSNIYWPFKFNPLAINRTEAKQYLQKLMSDAIDYISEEEVISLSFSGGYDISAIGGLLREKFPDKYYKAFSYYYKNILVDSDADIAKRQAKLLNLDFKAYEAYNGNIIESITNNAKWGDFRANFVNEIDTWVTLRNQQTSNSEMLITGEEFFGINNFKGNHIRKTLKSLGINHLENLKNILSLLPKALSDLIKHGISEFYEEIRNEIPTYDNNLDTLQHSYLIYNLPHVLLPWRELFSGRNFRVYMPWLVNNIIDFIQILPCEFRTGKNLFKECVKDKMPELFSIERATKGNNSPVWRNELMLNISLLESYLSDNQSILDNIIDPNIIMEIFTKLNKTNLVLNKLQYLNDKLYRRLPNISNLASKMISEPQLGYEAFIIRLLTLRQALAK